MLNRVPTAINQAARLVTLRHPNALDCVIFRKTVTREDDPAGTMGGAPTLGGMGVLDPSDEAEFDWDKVGEGKLLFTGPYEGESKVDRDDGVVPQSLSQGLVEFTKFGDELVSPGLVSSDEPELKKYDVVYALPGGGVHMAFEVVDIVSRSNIPPYQRAYVFNARDDLQFLDPDVPDALTP